MKSEKNSRKPLRVKTFIISLIMVTMAVILYLVFFGFNGIDKQVSRVLTGTWLRSDGVYEIVIKEVASDGQLIAEYYNPGPINVGKAGWRMVNENVRIYVELRDVNYPGSLYQLDYNKKTKELKGTYYQAVEQQTYEVSFSKIK